MMEVQLGLSFGYWRRRETRRYYRGLTIVETMARWYAGGRIWTPLVTVVVEYRLPRAA